MEKHKKGFWRGFTWKRMLKSFIFIFLLTLFVDIIIDIRHPGAPFQPGGLLRRFITTVILSFVFALWHEPGIDDKPNTDQRAA
jgi:hypothetical protein